MPIIDNLNNQMSKLDLGIDIDGVITASPDFFASLSNRWQQEGGRVHIVSSRSDNLETRRATLNDLGALVTCGYRHIAVIHRQS